MTSYDSSRRDFLLFLGRSAAGAALAGSLWPGCTSTGTRSPGRLPFEPLPAGTHDRLSLAAGFRHQIVLRWGDPLNARGEKFGFNNDFLALRPLTGAGPGEYLMWVNHEYHDPFFNSGYRPGGARTRAQVDLERREVGGSIVHLRRAGAEWKMVGGSKYNRRFDALTPIPFAGGRVRGAASALGTFGGCGGGVTPWGTVLSCEENYQNFYGEAVIENGRRVVKEVDAYLSWMKFYRLPPEHYGWVVEVELESGRAKKLLSLGRFSHESATCARAADGRAVVYSGDDCAGEHLYKFIASRPGSLESGTLYVADMGAGRWLPLDREKDPRLKKEFKDHTDMLVHTRRAAKIVGATPLDRPEDIEIDSQTGHVYVALTNNKKQGNYFGSILKIQQRDPLALEFESETFLTGGPGLGFACPDNLAFDPRGGFWFCTDMAGDSMGQTPYAEFGNNSLFYVPLEGEGAGRPVRVATGPVGAELTGPCFSPDGRTLFLSVQHPGEFSTDASDLRSHWPDGGNSVPAPCVVAISGPALDGLMKTGGG